MSLGNSFLTVQIVSVPSDSGTWKELATQGKTSITLDLSQVVAMVRAAIVHKGTSKGAKLLALDASHIGAMVGPRLMAAYLKSHPAPAVEFGWSHVWLVGPTKGSTR